MNDHNRNLPVCKAIEKSTAIIPAYPTTPASDDLYSQYKEEKDIDPEDISRAKRPNEEGNIEAVDQNIMSIGVKVDDMDVPSSDSEEDEEGIGNEDEENSYYSLGGDGHIDLEEDHGEG